MANKDLIDLVWDVEATTLRRLLARQKGTSTRLAITC
jgi:hypothetical protein